MALEFRHLQQTLQDYINEVKELYSDNIVREGHNASGDLIKSIKVILQKNNTSIEVSLSLNEYWKYLESGTRPHWPPMDAILEWIRVKPVIPVERNGNLPTEKQLAYLISRKIAQEGTPETNLLENTLETVNAKYDELISEAIDKDLDEGLTAILLEFHTA